MPEATAADIARMRQAVQLRDRCARAAVDHATNTGVPLTLAQARVAYDAMRDILAEADRRPQVVFHPGMRFGEAQVRGISTEAIAGLVWAGEGVDTTASEYDLTRQEVIVACWFVARHGTRAWRKRWATWLKDVDGELWHGRWDVPEPPSRDEAEQGAAS